jgi:hypothetical protein
LTCCENAYGSGYNGWNNDVFSINVTNCVCAGPCASQCGIDDYCVTGADISSQSCLSCVKSATASGGACNSAFAPSCNSSCKQFAGCYAGCP